MTERICESSGDRTSRFAGSAGLGAGLATGALLFAASTVFGSAHRLNVADFDFAGLAVCAAALEAALSRPSATAANADAPATAVAARALAGLTGLCLLALWIGPFVAPAHATTIAFEVVGAALMIVGAGLRAAAIGRLGARFSSVNAVACDARLETRGLYHRLAHPSELGLLLIAGGGLLLTGWTPGWVLAAVLYGLTALRVRLEEAALVVRHGDLYRRYRASTFDPLPTLFPGKST